MQCLYFKMLAWNNRPVMREMSTQPRILHFACPNPKYQRNWVDYVYNIIHLSFFIFLPRKCVWLRLKRAFGQISESSESVFCARIIFGMFPALEYPQGQRTNNCKMQPKFAQNSILCQKKETKNHISFHKIS